MATKKNPAAEMAAVAAKQGKAAAKDAGPARKKASDEPDALKPVIKLPKSTAAVGDLLYDTQQKRFALQKEIDALQAVESACRDFLIENLQKGEATGARGKKALVYVENKEVLQVEDWTKLYGYILANIKRMPGLWGLLQKRLGESMAKELFADPKEGKKLKGAIKKVEVPVVRVNKL
jgi:hypothetical protein